MNLALETKAIKISDLQINGHVYIPPMAGYTDLVYRQLCRDFDPDVIVSTEMLSSKALKYEKEKSHKMDIPAGDPMTGVQIFGHEPEIMANAARLASDSPAKFIDINMGCPVAKIVKGCDGAALMRDPDLACEIVKSVMSATDLPVTVKTRLGWDYDSLNASDLAKRFQDIGVQALTIHGRTRSQKYEGKARWDLIADVVSAVDIPVFANGDVRSLEDVEKILEVTKASGVAIARGTMGRPWFSKQVNHFIRTGEKLADPDTNQKIDLALKHVKMLIEYRGLKAGARESRKHVVNYTYGMPGSSQLRARLSKLSSIAEAEDMLEELRQKTLERSK